MTLYWHLYSNHSWLITYFLFQYYRRHSLWRRFYACATSYLTSHVIECESCFLIEKMYFLTVFWRPYSVIRNFCETTAIIPGMKNFSFHIFFFVLFDLRLLSCFWSLDFRKFHSVKFLQIPLKSSMTRQETQIKNSPYNFRWLLYKVNRKIKRKYRVRKI